MVRLEQLHLAVVVVRAAGGPRPIIQGYRHSGGWAGGVGMKQGWVVTLDVAQALPMGHCQGHTSTPHPSTKGQM